MQLATSDYLEKLRSEKAKLFGHHCGYVHA